MSDALYPSAAMAVLIASELRKEFSGDPLFENVSFTVGRKDRLSLAGANGAGKTTLLRALAGLVPYEGRISVGGEDARRLGRKELARRVALVPQVPTMPPESSVAEYVLLGRTPHLSYFGSERRSDREAAAAALERLDLGGLAGRRLDSLSGGERQRAVLARALAQDAPILLLDEPTTALDVGRQQQALELVDGLRAGGGLTVVCAMHDLTLAALYADRLLLLDRGRLVASGGAGEVLTQALIREHYGADVAVVGVPEAGPVIVPVRRASPARDARAGRPQ
jgi:iron complex transport system ATP-binding protein